MQLFLRPLRLSLVILLFASPLWGQTATKQLNLGQDKLRSEFQELANQNKDIEAFKERHWMKDIAEHYWIQNFHGQNQTSSPQDFSAAVFELRHLLSSQVYRVGAIFHSIGNLFHLVFSRPIESLSNFFYLKEDILFPIGMSLFFLLLIHLWQWSPALRRDLRNRFGSASSGLLLLLLVFALLFSFLTKNFAFLLLLMSLLCMIYSRRNKAVFIGLAAALCFYISMAPYFTELQISVNRWTSVEAFHTKRNRLNYSPESLASLKAWQKSVWASWNGDSAAAEDWIKQATPSPEKGIVEANLAFNIANVKETIQRYLDLQKKYGNHQTILFNLSQLYTLDQDLVSADDVQAKIPKENYQNLVKQLGKSTFKLLQPIPHSTFEPMVLESFRNWIRIFSQKNKNRFRALIGFFLPWLLFLLFFLRRKIGSGLCEETGLPTNSILEPYCHMAQQIHQRSRSLDPNVRLKFSKLQRHFEQTKNKQILSWVWIFPASYEVINKRPLLALVMSTLLCILLWLGLSVYYRNLILSIFSRRVSAQILPSSLCWPLLIIGFVIYAFFVWRTRKKVLE